MPYCERCKKQKSEKDFDKHEVYCFECYNDMKRIYRKYANQIARKSKQWLEEIRK